MAQEAAHAEQVERLQQEAQSARHQVALLEQRLVEEQRLYADLDARCDSLQAAGIDAEARLTLQQVIATGSFLGRLTGELMT